jgi:hypothetical protein
MPNFLVTHHAGDTFCLDEFLNLEKRAVRVLPREIKWEMSWYLPQAEQVITQWEAPTEQAVRVAMERLGMCHKLSLLRIENATPVFPKRYAAYRQARAAASKRIPHGERELSGAYGESIVTLLQTRAGTPHGK